MLDTAYILLCVIYMNIICLLSVRPCIQTYNFFKDIKLNSSYEVFIVIDDNTYDIPGYDGIVKVIKIDNIECEQNGFKSCVLWLNNIACSRDKALYYFTKEDIDYNHIWFVEEDVFIPSIQTIERIDNKYPTGDLLCREHLILRERRNYWHWGHVFNQIRIPLPYASSMICAIRCSKKMLNSIQRYAKEHNNLFLDETLFNTLALYNNLDVVCIPELSSIEWRRDWGLADINDDNLYHPIKNITYQYHLRDKLKELTHTNTNNTNNVI
jgi:hypothetical protein